MSGAPLPTPDRFDRQQFVGRFGGVYEHSPWIAEAAFDAGITCSPAAAEQLAEPLAAIVDRSSREARLALLRAHPELVGKLAVTGSLTSESRSEQSSAGLDRCSAEEFAEFQRLNERYNSTFGFPFIIAVRGLTRADILAAFRRRVDNDPEAEFATALGEVHRIARLRLAALARG